MSVFYGAPAGPHIGQCQNLIMPESSSGLPLIRSLTGGRHCLAPVLGLGSELADDRDICGGCRMRTEAFRQRTIDQFLASLDAETAWSWVATAERLLVGQRANYTERARLRASMAELYGRRRDIERSQSLVDAVLAAFPPPVATSQSLL